MPLIREMKKYLQPKSLFLPINLFPILELLGKLITAKGELPFQIPTRTMKADD